MSSSGADDGWFWAEQGSEEPQGRVGWSELKEMARQGDLDPSSLVWKEGMKEWARADSVDGLFLAPPPLPESDETLHEGYPENPSTGDPSLPEPEHTTGREKKQEGYGVLFDVSVYIALFASILVVLHSFSILFFAYEKVYLSWNELLYASIQPVYLTLGILFIVSSVNARHIYEPKLQNFLFKSSCFLFFTSFYPIIKALISLIYSDMYVARMRITDTILAMILSLCLYYLIYTINFHLDNSNKGIEYNFNFNFMLGYTFSISFSWILIRLLFYTGIISSLVHIYLVYYSVQQVT